ncbi:MULTISPECIES: VG15 protein [Streptomyces]|uniref:Uncharacterized protein n=1 Tax=Streptomyces turgidiscabies (strain Car8) TaxID=698760 RepID=L7EYY4_STRT8|nr:MULTISPECIES: hypothetical protein [Streptomyces]ELP64623.1 hypothetical protein STRTUCAR8_09219 [Streptomyces turgidiscabies Car8]MDX3491545.1 hypothetical protein [Streptomyces turgidiscabies]GAQ73151.1 hypothetical protein T45_04907 [Streptomyces turgidiscabies]
MLISRGPVYKSRESATFNDGDRYHDNCHCYAMPVWSRDQYQSSELTALSRQYEALWPEVHEGPQRKGRSDRLAPLHPQQAASRSPGGAAVH